MNGFLSRKSFFVCFFSLLELMKCCMIQFITMFFPNLCRKCLNYGVILLYHESQLCFNFITPLDLPQSGPVRPDHLTANPAQILFALVASLLDWHDTNCCPCRSASDSLHWLNVDNWLYEDVYYVLLLSAVDLLIWQQGSWCNMRTQRRALLSLWLADQIGKFSLV